MESDEVGEAQGVVLSFRALIDGETDTYVVEILDKYHMCFHIPSLGPCRSSFTRIFFPGMTGFLVAFPSHSATM